MNKEIKVLRVEPGLPPVEKTIQSGLQSLQHEVGGYIECVYPFEDDVVLIVNEEGKINGLPLNRSLRDDEGEIYDVIAGSFIVAGITEDSFCSLDGELRETITFTGDNPVSFAWNRGRLYCVFPDGSLTIYENGEAIRSIPLSFDLSMDVIDGKAFRYEFTDARLYLFCGGEMNTVMLDSDSETAVYYAGSVLNHLADREELLVWSYNREKLEKSGDTYYYLGSFPEYTVRELIERAVAQLKTYHVNQDTTLN